MYKAADGSLIPNRGEISITHVEDDNEPYEFVFQDAPVHCPIISVRYLVTRDCWVTFHKNGGFIAYPTGKRINFIVKDGVFFVALNVLPPGSRKKQKPGFARPGE